MRLPVSLVIPRFARGSLQQLRGVINRLRDLAIVVNKLPRIDRSPDPDDNYLLALAEEGRANFLLTGDKSLLELKRHKSTRIVPPGTLVDLLKDKATR